MLELLEHLIKPLVKVTDKQYQNDLDRYISSKNPSNTAEVEYWQREYDKRQNQQGWLI